MGIFLVGDDVMGMGLLAQPKALNLSAHVQENI